MGDVLAVCVSVLAMRINSILFSKSDFLVKMNFQALSEPIIPLLLSLSPSLHLSNAHTHSHCYVCTCITHTQAKRSLLLLRDHQSSSASAGASGTGSLSAFSQLFLQRHDFWLQYDQYAWVGPMPAEADTHPGSGRVRPDVQDYLLDFTRRAYWPRRLVSLLNQVSERVSKNNDNNSSSNKKRSCSTCAR